MKARLVIAAQTGALMGLVAIALYQAGELRNARLLLAEAAQPPPELPTSTNQRPLRLRLQSLPPINIKTEVRELDWRNIESPDYATYVGNLRRIGCPEETIRDIVVADINQLYAERRRALRTPGADWEFWRHPDEGPMPGSGDGESERRTALARLEQERRNLITSLLGEGAVQAELAERSAEAMDDRNLQFLDPAKRRAMAEAIARWELARDQSEAADDPERAEAQRAAAAEALEQAIASLLTPGEREQYELRSSPLAEELRERLRGFGATRDEFERIFRIEREAEDERRRLLETAQSLPEPQLDERIEASHLEQEARIRELLPPQRYAEYRRSADPDYQTLFSLARDHAMPTEVANQVWNMRQEVENQTDRIRRNPLLTEEQKVLALGAIRDETQSAIVDVLGEPLLRAYEREGGGWLIDLTEPVDLGESGMAITPPPLPEIPANRAQQAGVLPPP